MLNIIRNFHLVSKMSLTICIPAGNVCLFPHPSQYLVISGSVCVFVAILVSVKWYLGGLS